MTHKNERGQVLILVIFGIVAIIAVAGLALDGGRLHQIRRQIQNGADAAALAGGRVLLEKRLENCGESLTQAELNAIDDAVAQAVIQYAKSNGVDHADPNGGIEAWYVQATDTVSGTTTVDVSQAGFHLLTSMNNVTGLRVTLTLTESTTFMKVVGQDEMIARGEATAMVGPTESQTPSGPILPYAVPDEVVYHMQPGDEFYVNDDGALCKEADPDHCAINEYESASNSWRGWLNFNWIYNTEYANPDTAGDLYRTIKSSSNNADLTYFIENPEAVPPIFPGTPPDPWPVTDPDTTEYFVDGDFIHGEPGEKAAMGAIYDEYAGMTVYAPLFDLIYIAPYLENNSPDPFPAPDGSWPSNFNNNTYLYHIVGFVALEVCDPDTDTDCNPNDKDLRGTFEQVILGQANITPTDSIPCTLEGFTAVVLWE
jgi:hypothetical protein